MQTETRPMYSVHLTNRGHIRTFTIDSLGHEGWEVREAHDSDVLRQARYTDWHRVERARTMFDLRANLLTEEGWTETRD
jgi:hypothetical protein